MLRSAVIVEQKSAVSASHINVLKDDGLSVVQTSATSAFPFFIIYLGEVEWFSSPYLHRI